MDITKLKFVRSKHLLRLYGMSSKSAGHFLTHLADEGIIELWSEETSKKSLYQIKDQKKFIKSCENYSLRNKPLYEKLHKRRSDNLKKKSK